VKTREAMQQLPTPSRRPGGGNRIRIIAFALVTAACGVAALVYVLTRSSGTTGASDDVVAAALAEPHVLLLRGEPDATRPRTVEVAPLEHPDQAVPTSMQCQRVAFAGGRGLCLTLGYDLDKGSAYIFDDRLDFVTKVPAQGLPSRAKVSADGHWGAMTFFVFGHSYADGSFSTATQIVDMTTGDLVGNLEDFTTYRDGQPIKEQDFNFWGITFEGGAGTFYATLGTGGQTYLVHGDVAEKRLDVVTDQVECPSLSPDGKTLVFKVRVEGSGSVEWRLWAMDVATGERRQLAETRNVDDQVEWLDATHILYSPATVVPSTWVLDVTSNAPPTEFADSVVSPAVVRGAA
jgi:hypothetical protein